MNLKHDSLRLSAVDRPSNITSLLAGWSNGDTACSEELAPLIYDELQQIARRVFRSESARHTLQPTALVHEAYVRLIKVEVEWNNRTHFFALAARMMRRLLINHAEARATEKRGGGAIHVTLSEDSSTAPDVDIEFLDLNRALEALAEYNQRMSDLIDLQYFGGMTIEEISNVTGLSQRTIGRDLRFARAWLKDYLTG